MFEENFFKELLQGFREGSSIFIGRAYDPPKILSDRAENFFGGRQNTFTEVKSRVLKNIEPFVLLKKYVKP